MVEVRELCTGIYSVSNGMGRSWTVTLGPVFSDIRNECGQRIDPSSSLGGKLSRLVAQFRES